MKKIFFLFIICLTFTPIASARTLYWDRIDVNLYINQDASINVEEKQDYVFNGAWNGGIRWISKNGLDSITDISLFEGNKEYTPGSLHKYCYEIDDAGSVTEVKWRSRNEEDPEYTNTPLTFTLKYKALGAIQYNSITDTVHWNAIFPSRDGDVNSAAVYVHLPSGIDKNTVVIGSNSPKASWKWSGPYTIVFEGKNIEADETMDVMVSFPKGFVARPPESVLFAKRISFLPILFIPLLVFAFMLWYGYRYGRDPEVTGVPATLDHLPADISPALAATIIDEQFGIEEVVGTIIDLARRGYLLITVIPKVNMFIGEDYIYKVLKVDDKIAKHEMEILKGIFEEPKVGDEIKISELKKKADGTRFQRGIFDAKDAVYAEMVNQKYFMEDPRKEVKKYILYGFLVALIGFPLILLGSNVFLALILFGVLAFLSPFFWVVVLIMNEKHYIFGVLFGSVIIGFVCGAWVLLSQEFGYLFSSPLTFAGIGFYLSGIIIGLFAMYMPRKTLEGAIARAKWEAFKNYLVSLSDPDKISQKEEIFEKYLPYAIALELGDKWVKKFSGLNIVAPNWYQPVSHSSGISGQGVGDSFGGFGGGSSGGGGAGRSFTIDGMASGLTSMHSSLQSSSSSSSSSSGGGGSGGGGW